MRISTSGMFNQGLAALMQRQQELSRTQLEMSSKTRLLQAADDPAAWANAQRLDHAVAQLDQYDRSSDLVEHRLRLQEQSLSDSGDLLTRASELAVQANNPALGSSERKLIATELRALRGELLGIANRDDGNGRSLFAGTRDGVAPFAESAGGVSYAGDDGRNRVDIAPQQSVADTDPGSAVFLRVRTGDGQVRGSAAAANAGSAVLQSTAVVDNAAWNAAAAPLRVEFTAADAYRVVDSAGTVLSTGAYASGQAIDAGGARLTLTGTPATGDGIAVERAPTRDIFATLQTLADALDAPLTTDADRARAGNAIGAAIGDLGTAQTHLLSVRADTGARLATIDRLTDTREADGIALKDTLSGLRDLDYAEAATRLSLQATALDAAQRVMVKLQSLSLFDRL